MYLTFLPNQHIFLSVVPYGLASFHIDLDLPCHYTITIPCSYDYKNVLVFKKTFAYFTSPKKLLYSLPISKMLIIFTKPTHFSITHGQRNGKIHIVC